MEECIKFLQSKEAILEDPIELENSIKESLALNYDINDIKKMLIDGYEGSLEILYELWNWISFLSEEGTSIKDVVEETIKKIIIQNYDRQKTLSLVQTPNTIDDTVKWLSKLVDSRVWRLTVYELAEQPQNDDCAFLNLAMTCMAFNQKYIAELTRVPKSWTEFSTLMNCVTHLLEPLLLAFAANPHTHYLLNDWQILRERCFSSAASPAFSPTEEGGSAGTRDSAAACAGEELSLAAELCADADATAEEREAEEAEDNEDDAETTTKKRKKKDNNNSNKVNSSGKNSNNSKSGCAANAARLRQLPDYLNRFLEMGCHSEQTYLIIQSLLQTLNQRSRNHLPMRLSRLLEQEALLRDRDVARYSVYFHGAQNYPEAMTAIRAIIVDKRLPAKEIAQLYAAYKEDVTPPVELLRFPLFIDLVSDALFISEERLLPETQTHYSFLLAYAGVVEEVSAEGGGGERLFSRSTEVAEHHQLIATLSKVCRTWINATGQTIGLRSFRDMPAVLEGIAKSRPVSYGVFRFVCAMFEKRCADFELNLESMKPYMILVNELAQCNPQLHSRLLTLITKLLGGGHLVQAAGGGGRLRDGSSGGIGGGGGVVGGDLRGRVGGGLGGRDCLASQTLIAGRRRVGSGGGGGTTMMQHHHLDQMEDHQDVQQKQQQRRMEAALLDLTQIEYQKNVVDLLLHLIMQGYDVRSIDTMRKLFVEQIVDMSIVRYFVTELLMMARPPYSQAFMKAFHPLASHSDIQSGLNSLVQSDLSRKFLDYCKSEMRSLA